MKIKEYKRCKKGLWDTTIPDVEFDNNGISNYYYTIEKMNREYPKGQSGEKKWNNILNIIRKNNSNNKYDCLIGVSGGTDSSYLLHLAKKEWNLNPLAVNLDNGWSTDIAVKNIKKVTNALNIDLETYVIDYEEVKEVLRSYVKAGLPWIDGPTDLAIKAVLYRTAVKEKIKYIFIGDDFRSEGKQPAQWTYTDAKQLKFLCNKYENLKLKTFPYMTLSNIFHFNVIKKIRAYKPFYYLKYDKVSAQKYLEKNYNWEYYGGHHHENLFTRFSIAYWLLRKFNIDKRIITLSAQVVTGNISRNIAINELKQHPYDINQMELDRDLVIKKLGMTNKEFMNCWNDENKYFFNYPSYYPFIKKNKKLINLFSKYFMPMKSKIMFSDK